MEDFNKYTLGCISRIMTLENPRLTFWLMGISIQGICRLPIRSYGAGRSKKRSVSVRCLRSYRQPVS